MSQMGRDKSTRQPTRKLLVAALTSMLLAVCFISCGGGRCTCGSHRRKRNRRQLRYWFRIRIGLSSEQSLPEDEEQFDSLSLRSLSADGEGQVDTYDLIRSFAGPNPIEAPDLTR